MFKLQAGIISVGTILLLLCLTKYGECGNKKPKGGSSGERCTIKGMVPGPDIGITSWGRWTGYVTCPPYKRITGFRLQVETEQGHFDDDTALNGIQFSCEGGTYSNEIQYRWGSWTVWERCDAGYVTELDMKGMASVGPYKDDYGATNVRVRCSKGVEKTGDGLKEGNWLGYRGCSSKYHICGARAKIEDYQKAGDDTALNRIQLGCCPDSPAIVPGPDIGITSWGRWTGYVTCPPYKRITGFRLQVEKEQGHFDDDTALNGIQFSCEGGTYSNEIQYRWGSWTVWERCDAGYVTELDLKGMASAGPSKDDYGATNVRVRCSKGDEKTGDGLKEGNWLGYRGCNSSYHICGARAKIEDYQRAVDDTALNRIQLGCCQDGPC